MKKMSKKILSIVLCALVPAGTAAVMTANLSQLRRILPRAIIAISLRTIAMR